LIFTPTAVAGVVVVDVERREDERGFFARTFDRAEFLAAGLEAPAEQCSLSYNHRAGTLRGMHYQVAPGLETKLVRCTRGALLDVVVDVRPGSPTYLRSFAVELTAENRRSLHISPLLAHGFQTLVDDTEVAYQISGRHTPDAERGLRHDDPALGLSWPLEVSVISRRDAGWPMLGTGAA
jgi:dTDP-4-dehydrorhamnose 3,5-epimerase